MKISISSFAMVFVLFWLASCASSRNMAFDPAGSWDYIVSDTPNGDVEGTLVISKSGDDYSGEIRSQAGSVSLDGMQIEGKNLNAVFVFQGTELSLSGTFEQDTFNGEVKAGYDSFAMTANRSN